MKREDIQLERLFAAAREVETAPAVEMPPHLAGRVIAHWRAGACKEDSWQMLALIFRRALVCAGLAGAVGFDAAGDGSVGGVCGLRPVQEAGEEVHDYAPSI